MQKGDKSFYNILFKAVEIIHFTHTKRKPFESISKRGLKEGSHQNSRVYKSCCEPLDINSIFTRYFKRYFLALIHYVKN